MTGPLVRVEDVTKRYGGRVALAELDITLRAGEILALVGHNGAGKSTLIKLLLGLIRPDAGRIAVLGHDPGRPGAAEARRAIGFLPETIAFHPNMTGAELLGFYARLKGAPVAANRDLLARVGLAPVAGQRVGGYSKGMRQRLGLAQALIGRPRLLLLDEPTTGLDPELRQAFYAILSELAAEGVGILLSSHALAELEHRADRVIVLRQGRKVADGTLTDLRRMAGDPVRILVRLAAAQPVAVFAGGEAGGVAQPCARRIEIICPATDKMDRLRAVLNGPDPVADIELLHASLDEIYAGLLRRDAEQVR